MADSAALVAMSGGVDSSVAAYLMLHEGWRCMGVTMRLLDNEALGLGVESGCCSLEDVEDARAVARKLGIAYYVFNFAADFCAQVIQPFAEAYQRGETPNPCILCNRRLKFDRLYRRARELGQEVIATGHYARITNRGGRFLLRKALDSSKDQSYMLYTMTQEQLARTRFPLGGRYKEEVRAIAEKQGFVTAQKPDSQDICFVPDGDYGAFLERFTGIPCCPGAVLDQGGQVIGQHRGAVRYTLGQRKGLGLAMGKPMYVCGKSMKDNTVTVGEESALYARECYAGDVNLITEDSLSGATAVTAKVRYRQREQPATILPQTNGTVRVVFDRPQRAITPGQAVVWYQGDVVVGGGTVQAVTG